MGHRLVVFGSTSSIAKILLPTLGFEPNEILSFDRDRSQSGSNEFIPLDNQYSLDWSKVSAVETLVLKVLSERVQEPVLVLNFMGHFGNIQTIDELDIQDVIVTTSNNLIPFLISAKIASSFSPGSKVIAFSGAGVGGNNLDDSSIGYLAAKASMAVLIESIDRQLCSKGVRFGLIAPGAFPSQMQYAVAIQQPEKLPNDRVMRARDTMNSNPSVDKLSNLVKFLNSNPEQLGGRTWSANFDELTNHGDNFGRLRRIY
jgi:NAD(P)-dependent dehydrogenase (short-subunit alcohol dehydrogenase family)